MEQQTAKNYRYPGVTPFTTGQASIFFGREGDTNDFYRLIRREPLVVLYGKSGLGKSSLLNAGIIPRCQQEGEYSPLIIRFGAWTEQANETPLSISKKVITKGFEAPTLLDRLLPDDTSLWSCAKNRQLNAINRDQGGRPLLLFDQFEELFSYPDVEVAAFQQELSELLHTGIPLRFRRRLESIDATEEEEDQLEAGLNARIVFAIRSDRMHLLDRLKDYLPNVLRHTFELKALTKKDAKDAILLPAQAEGDFQTPPFDYTPAALSHLINYLEDPQDQRIEGILLQMLCEHYERRQVEAQGTTLLDLPQIGDPKQVVKKYYDEKIENLPTGEQTAARRLIEDGLVSEGEAMRLSLHESYILHEFGVQKKMLEDLVDSRLLRSEPFLRGGYTYELSHDRLVPPVLQARSQRREVEAQLKAAQQAKELEAARKRLRTLRGLLAIAILAFVAAGYFAWDANQKKAEAEIAKTEALEQSEEAKKQKDRAEKALEDYQRENAAKERIKFNNLESRAITILDVGGCPKELLEEMQDIAGIHPDSLLLKDKLSSLRNKNPNCR